jgi:hypothetical protein
MQAVNDLRAIVQGAEQAEARGDHMGAERLLRQALVLQEASLGAQHPEVANTLNNLAIVCEMNGKIVDAEACYRRAYAIATSSLPASDPFVTTSRENLEQFCKARGVPFRQTPPVAASSAPVPAPASPPPKAATPPSPHAAPPPAKQPPPTPQPRATVPPPPPPAQPRASSAVVMPPRTLMASVATQEPSRVTGMALGLAVLAALIVAGWFLVDSKSAERTALAPAPSTEASAPSTTAPAPNPPPAVAAAPEPAPEPEPAAPPPSAAEPVAPPPSPVAAAPERPAATTRGSSVSVVSAQLCRSLTTGGAWRCTPASDEQGPGTLYFYTRVAAPRDTTIEHRWYRGDSLHQRVPLRIRANPSGFRTYSRTTVTAERAGDWKVELRTQDGQLLDEQTFSVQ